MIRLTRAMAIGAILCGLAPAAARADIVITATDVTIGPGDIGTMDFSITSTTSDALSYFFLALQITPSAGTTSILPFAPTQSDPYGNPNYVFAGQSFGNDNSLPFWSAGGGQVIDGGDSSDGSLGYVTLPATVGTAGSYLASVAFQSAPGATLGDSFQISLITLDNAQPGQAPSEFDDANGDAYSSSYYSLSGGTVTIGAVAVPEPSSLAIAALPALCGLVLYTRRRAVCP